MQKIILTLMAAAALPLALAAKKSSYYNEEAQQFEFISPSGNIRCQGDHAASDEDEGSKGVECSVFSGAGRLPTLPKLPKPKDCDMVGITVFSVEATGKATRLAVCIGDTYYNLSGSVPVLPYGKTVQGDGWQCTSSKEGLRCENDDGHGFHLSRSQQKLF